MKMRNKFFIVIKYNWLNKIKKTEINLKMTMIKKKNIINNNYKIKYKSNNHYERKNYI
jgi:hypothetical protein